MNMFFRDLFSTGAAPVSDALFMFIFRIFGFDFTTVWPVPNGFHVPAIGSGGQNSAITKCDSFAAKPYWN